jgi:hypothetical protein
MVVVRNMRACAHSSSGYRGRAAWGRCLFCYDCRDCRDCYHAGTHVLIMMDVRIGVVLRIRFKIWVVAKMQDRRFVVLHEGHTGSPEMNDHTT